MGNKIKRSQRALFVDTAQSTGSPTYKLVGVGVTTGQANMNPQTTTETYISVDSATTSVDSYQKAMPVEMTPESDDDAFLFIQNIADNELVGADCETTIVEVDYWQTSTTSGWPARQRTVAISVDNDLGGDGGKPAKLSCTFHYQGVPVSGYYEPVSAIFTSA
jgi:hypothetical protein